MLDRFQYNGRHYSRAAIPLFYLQIKFALDSLTQAILGASVGEVYLGKKLGNRAAIAGAILATIPDLDVILYAWHDHYEMLSIHRGYSHSLVGSLAGATGLTFILNRFKGFKDVQFGRLWVFTWLALITHILLDLFTGFGTQFLLPFSNMRLGLDSINIIDPIYTLPLLVGLILSLRVNNETPHRSRYNRWGFWISTSYLLMTLGFKHYIQSTFEQQLNTQKIQHMDILTLPVGIGSIYWYGVARTEDQVYLQKYSLLKGAVSQMNTFPINEEFLDGIDPQMAECMRWFAKGFYTVEKVGDHIRVFNLQVDMRGPVSNHGHLSPTKGYFELANKAGESVMWSGTLTDERQIGIGQ